MGIVPDWDFLGDPVFEHKNDSDFIPLILHSQTPFEKIPTLTPLFLIGYFLHILY